MAKWQIEPSEQFVKDQEWYASKHPDELAAVLNNLKRYLSQLNCAKNALCVQAGYLHTEGKGVIAIDQKGGGKDLQQTRLYVYACDTTGVLHIITIGNKNTQDHDIAFAHKIASGLKKAE